MNGIMHIAVSTVRRSIRDRTFVLVGLVAPFLIMAALSATIGSALAGEFRPSLTLSDETGTGLGGSIVDDLQNRGFEDMSLAADEVTARQAVDDGDADAAIVLPRSLFSASTSEPIVVVAQAQNEISRNIATSLAEQVANAVSTERLLARLGASSGDMSAPITLSVTEDIGSSVLTDATYFAVGMSGFFSFFTASIFLANYHQERKQSTLARLLLAPVGRLAPIAGKSVGVAVLTVISLVVLVVASSVLLGADWGPPLGALAIVLALTFTAVCVGAAIVTLTKTEEAAAQTGIVVATGWAIFGGVFVEIPSTGPLATGAQLSPFTWALDGIGQNAGTGAVGEVLVAAAAIALFGAVALVIVIAGRQRLARP